MSVRDRLGPIIADLQRGFGNQPAYKQQQFDEIIVRLQAVANARAVYDRVQFINFTLATMNAIGEISPKEAGDAWLRELEIYERDL
jgi:hypothetical protein